MTTTTISSMTGLNRWIIDGQKVHFFHYRSHSEHKSGKGGFTRAYILNPDGSERFAARADCSDKDNFCYARGREIAFGRLLKFVQEQKA